MTFRLKTSLARKYYKYLSPTKYKIAKFEGVEFCIRPDNYIDRQLWLEGGYEKKQLQTMLSVARNNHFDTFIDIGTNFGLYSCILGSENAIPEVQSFECDPRNLFQLYGHLAMNNLLEKVTVHQKAVGDEASTKQFSLAHKNNSGTSKIIQDTGAPVNDNSISVEQIKIDDYLPLISKTLLVKIDIEGYEENALKGMVNTLKNNKCFIQIELWDENQDRMQALFDDMGYSAIKQIDADFYFTNMDIEI